ncbi:MAG: 30S ribosomal protein S16 [Anaerolineaceae bacterium]|jgi:small subunit ribosomal protein S16|nr:30S ribosomal protein S16 [Anaerolineaceae bacterium]MDD4042133.1 30S ribosomal protein S16 [Anaerolineaceae bacterium]MDD4578587.1 30S ribosomal protein S16 [Anaerolineaceae bacterium]
MVRIRLRRVGSAHQPHYRVVVADKESPRDGRFIEIIGFYNPRTEPVTIELNEERVYHWLNVGAQPSERVQKLFKIVKLDDRFERFKAGEDQQALIEEASKLYQARASKIVAK